MSRYTGLSRRRPGCFGRADPSDPAIRAELTARSPEESFASNVGPLFALNPTMASSVPTTVSLVQATSPLSGNTASGAPAGRGADTTGAFATVMDQLSQALAARDAVTPAEVASPSLSTPQAQASLAASVPPQPEQVSPGNLLSKAEDATSLKSEPTPDKSRSAGKSTKDEDQNGPKQGSDRTSPPFLPDPVPSLPVAQALPQVQTGGTSTLSGNTGQDLNAQPTSVPAVQTSAGPGSATDGTMASTAPPMAADGLSTTIPRLQTSASQISDQSAVAAQAGLSVNAKGSVSGQQIGQTGTQDMPAEPHAKQAVAPQDHPVVSALLLPAAPAQPAEIQPQRAPIAASAVTTRTSLSDPARPSPLQPVSNGAVLSKFSADSSPPPPSVPSDVSTAALITPPANAPAQTPSTAAARTAEPVPPPAVQVAQALIEPVKVFLTSPAQSGSAAPHVTTIQIAPVELGRVEVRIERASDGLAKIELVAERPETLSRLIHDKSHLQQALDQAGIPQSGRTIEFSLAAPTTDHAGGASNLFGNTASGNGTSHNGSQRQSGPYPSQHLAQTDESPTVPAVYSQILRSGIDITA